jgi:ABC-type Na+ efflux pump permease subunit
VRLASEMSSRQETPPLPAGPIFVREALTAPRRLQHFLLRSGYVAGLLVLFYSVRQATIGFQDVQFAGDVATFSSLTFQIFCLLQLTLALFFSTLFTAAGIAQEKDRKTLILLLMTDMRSHELTYGKLLSSLLIVAVLLATSLPVFAALTMLGGVTWSQVFWAEAVIAAAAFASGSWGCLTAYWREKTFQTLAISVLGVVVYLFTVEGLVAALGSQSTIGATIAQLSPYRGLFGILNPLAEQTAGVAHVSGLLSVVSLLLIAAGLSIYTVLRLRVWNPSQSVHQSATAPAANESAPNAESTPPPQAVRHRTVWSNPVTWREIRTRAYGRKIIWIKLAYVVLALLMVMSTVSRVTNEEYVLGMVTPPAFAFIGIAIISLLLMNAQAVTSITNERDGRTLEPLLITDLSAREFMLGKIGGALWNAREMVVLPLLLLIWLSVSGAMPRLTAENCIYLVTSYLALSLFAIALGLHSGLTWENSRSAIGSSLGTMFFLFVGILIFMLLLVEAKSSFGIQMQSFIVFIGFGSLGLYSSLTHKNPSGALTLASIILPFLTFYAITEFLLGGSLGVCLCICAAYGFAMVAMLIPAMTDFDLALGHNAQDAA